MAKKIESLKEQLKEVSSLLNIFKSEAVQIRILELLFEKEFKSKGLSFDRGNGKTVREGKPGRPKLNKPEKKAGRKSKARRTNAGPTVFLSKLESENFFHQPRSLRDIVNYCNSKLVQTFKTTDFTSPMAKMVKENKLKKGRSADGKSYVFGK